MSKNNDILNKTFAHLTPIAPAPPTSSGRRRWVCRCDCGGEAVVLESNLKSGHTTSCGCAKRVDLTGKRIGRLTVLRRSDRTAPRGARRTPLWECRCDCGEIVYKATDVLTNPAQSMCKTCAGVYAAGKARANAGYESGTQLSKLKPRAPQSQNRSGMRGIYLDEKSGRYRVRIMLRGKQHHVGYFSTLDEAVKARLQAEEEFFGPFRQEQE